MLRVLWFQGGGRLSRIIQWITGSPFSHVAIMVDNCAYEAVARGIVKHGGLEAHRLRERAAAEWTVEVPAVQAADAQWWLERQVYEGYSITGLLAAGIFTLTGWAPVLAMPGEYICSGLAAEALSRAGIRLEGEDRLQTPASLYNALVVDPRQPRVVRTAW